MTHLIGTWLLFAVWQSTLILGLSLLLGRLFRKTPWQSHDLHLFGILAAVLAPTFSTVIASQNAGWLTVSRWSDVFAPLLSRSNVFGALLLVGMALFLILLGRGIVASRRLMFRAKPFPDRESQEALLRSAETLQNVSLPILFTSPNVKSPTVWCWGLHPAVVLPDELADKLPPQERDAIFLHELAHITRRDHLTALLTRICGMFLFWQPLYWLALKQADLLADEACDLLVLSRGNVSPETYTETLLRLAAGEKYKPAFQFLSRKEKIMKRITTILDFGEMPTQPSVKASRLWQCSALTVALLLSVTLAFCQEKKDTTAPQITKMEPANGAEDVDADAVTELCVTFDRDMNTGGFSWCGGGETFPETIGQPKWLNKRTCVLPVKLQPDKEYMLGINSRDFRNFKSAKGVPVVPVTYKFKTKGAGADLTSNDKTPNSLLSILKMEGVKSYPINKRIADFSDEIDLSTPENAYASQKSLIVSDCVDKYEQLSKMTKGNPPVPEREKIKEQITDEWRETYKTEFVVFEALVYEDKLAFVWGLRQFDKLYDGNFFIKEGDQWLNMGNAQCMTPQEMSERVISAPVFTTLAMRLTRKSPIWATPDNMMNTALCGFAPIDGFEPMEPGELLDKLNAKLQNAKNITTGYFRTWPKDGRLIGAICTNNPAGLRRVIESIPELEVIGIKQLDEKTFNAHQAKKRLSLTEKDQNESKAPKIAKMEPTNGAEDVDADAVTELRVTFDRDMNTDGYSWCGGGETYPETTGTPKWIDKRTCVLPVKLQPGKKYMLGINAQSYRNFKSAEGVPVVPVTYTFSTKEE